MSGRPLLSRVSLRTVVPLAMVLPVLAVVCALGVIVWINGRAAAADLERQIFDQAGQRIQQRLTEFVEVPGQINELNAHLIRNGSLDPDDLESWRDTLFKQIQAFETVSSIGFATPDRQTTWMMHFPGEDTFKWGIQNDRTGGLMVERLLDPDDGSIIEGTLVSYEYDPLTRPWYLAGIRNPDRQVWSEIYPWVGQRSELADLGLGLVLTVRDENDRLLGVHDTELSITQISTFLASLNISNGGTVYIVDEDAAMVAASTLAPLVRAPDTRISAHESDDPRVRAIAEYVDAAEGDPDASRDFALDASGESIRVRVQPFSHPAGLRWSVWIALPESQLLARTNAAQSQMIRTGIAATLIVLAFGIGLSLIMVRPLLRLVDQVRAIGEGEFETRSDVRFTAELGTLSRSLNEVGSHLEDRLRLKQSLELAMEVQQNLLPGAPPSVPGLDVFGHITYCDETGGDYYDYLDAPGMPDSSLGIALGDVTGHGISAALLMATARAGLRSHAAETRSLSELLELTNSMLVVDTKGVNFMTMLLVIVDAREGTLRWASAGQPPPFVFRPQSDDFVELSSSSLPLGVMDSARYSEVQVSGLGAGAVIVLGTDGLWETQNPAGEPFGTEAVRRIIRECASGTAEQIGRRLIRELDEHCAHASPGDDITFVVVKLDA